jgi:hypothetical protein
MNRPSVVAVLHSPKQTHEVTLKVSATSPFHPMPYKVLTADGKSGNRALFADLVVYWGDGSDAPFHSPGSWPLESALRLAGRQGDTYSVAITGTGLLLDISALSQGEPVGGCR